MAEPKVKRDLERIHLDRLAGLLAKQVHTSAAQLAFAGQGPINTDDHNLLEFGAAKAFFLRARRIEIGDQRKQPGLHGLWIETWLKDHRLSADDARAIYSNLSFFHPKDDPLVRAAAEEWLALSPDDPAAQLASARLALSHGDLTTSLSRLGKTAGPDALPIFLEASGRTIAARRTVWGEVALPVVAGDGQVSPEAKLQVEKICKLAPLQGCP